MVLILGYIFGASTLGGLAGALTAARVTETCPAISWTPWGGGLVRIPRGPGPGNLVGALACGPRRSSGLAGLLKPPLASAPPLAEGLGVRMAGRLPDVALRPPVPDERRRWSRSSSSSPTGPRAWYLVARQRRRV